ncbi:MAG: zinc ribbon domain-containing protein [Clostridia bacterium]|nr:zinc ribbon domain-containing protein [Clostridia bacterium]
MFCQKCGKEIETGAKFCGFCGAAAQETPVVEAAPVVEVAPVVQAEVKEAPKKSIKDTFNFILGIVFLVAGFTAFIASFIVFFQNIDYFYGFKSVLYILRDMIFYTTIVVYCVENGLKRAFFNKLLASGEGFAKTYNKICPFVYLALAALQLFSMFLWFVIFVTGGYSFSGLFTANTTEWFFFCITAVEGIKLFDKKNK